MRGVKQVLASTSRMNKRRNRFMPSRWKREDLEGKLQGPAHPNLKEIESMDDERYAAGPVGDIIHRCRQPTAAPDLHSSQRHSRE